jgi:hypothetical protein
MKRILFASLLLLVAAPAFAQQDRGDGKTEDGQKIVYEKNTKIDFDTKVIRGTQTAPVGISVVSHGSTTFEKFIPERRHFKLELLESAGLEAPAIILQR